MEKIYLLIFFIFGSVMGSFYHVIATRLSKGGSIVSPASHCEKCQHQLKWYELIPILSAYSSNNCVIDVSVLFMPIIPSSVFAIISLIA